MDRRQVFGWFGILLCLGVPIVYALTANFSDTVWQVTTLKADNYYLGAVDITGGMTTTLAYPEQPYSYTIWVDGAIYYAKNGATGAVTSNANAATIINACFNSLTMGRTWNELVTLKGSFILTTALLPSNYTTLDLTDAKLTASAIATPNMISLDTKSHIDIFGGQLDGASENTHGIQIVDSSDIHVSKIHVVNVGYNGLSIWGYNHNSTNIWVSDSYVENTGWPGFAAVGDSVKLNFSKNVFFTDCVSNITADAGFLVGEGNTENVHLIDCASYSAVHDGFIVWQGAAIGYPQKTIIINPYVWNAVGSGITDGGGYYTKITSPSIENVGYDGIYIFAGATGGEVSGGSVKNCGTASIWGRQNGVNLFSCSNYRIFGVIISDSLHLMRSVTVNKAIITGCDLTGVVGGGDALWVSGTETNFKVNNNLGYVTENSGITTILNTATSVVVTHGLSYTPNLQDITVTYAENPTNDAGSLYVDTITSTQFTVHCLRDPGASNLNVAWNARRTP